ncbi:hypothetical protein TWF694_002042 [Orbilia ellipsospora]|uniref:F-box domain-containing protein n=1 Tax=Orbilia ellipsospora TaxID=2528407 RepID=A0AAV9X4D0_9PEZI
MALTDLPNEILDQILFYLDDLVDLAKVGSTNKRFRNLVYPRINRKVTFGILCGKGGWSVDPAFEKLSEERIKCIREIEVMAIPPEQPRDPGYIEIPRHESPNPGFISDAWYGQELFNDRLCELLSRFEPAQLQSFTFYDHNYYKVFSGNDINTKTIISLTPPHSNLTRLKLTFDPCLEQECHVFNFPNLKYFHYSGNNVPSRYHNIFSLLHSCQDSLVELHCVNLTAPGMTRLFFERDSVPDIVLGYREWEGCKNCCQSTKNHEIIGRDAPSHNGANSNIAKRIRLGKLKHWECIGYYTATAKVFRTGDVIKHSPISTIDLGHESLRLHSKGNLNIDNLTSYQSMSPTSSKELDLYFRSFAGLEEASFNVWLGNNDSPIQGLPKDARLECLEGLKLNHADSLQLLKIRVGRVGLSHSELEQIGLALPKLRILETELDTRDVPDCIFDRDIFPNLRIFRDKAYDYSLRDLSKMDEIAIKVMDSAKKGKLSSRLQKIYFRYNDSGYTIKKGMSNVGPSMGYQEMEGSVYAASTSALATYGFAIEEVKGPSRYWFL